MPKKTLSQDVRKQIQRLRAEGVPDTDVMLRLQVSRSSVRRWAERVGFADNSSAPKKPRRKLSPDRQFVIAECGRLLRWPIKELRGHLSFFLPDAGKPGRPGRILKKQKDRGYSGASDLAYYRVFAKAGLKGIGKRNQAAPGTIAVHGVKVAWQNKKGKEKEAWALLLAERHSGYVNILIQQNLRPAMTLRCIRSFVGKFERMSGHSVPAIYFVADGNGQPTAPASWEKPRLGKEPMLTLVTVKGRTEERPVPCRVDPPSTGLGIAFHLDGEFEQTEDVRDEVKGWLEKYNRWGGGRTGHSKKIVQGPVEKLHQLHCLAEKSKKLKDRAPSLSLATFKRMLSPTGRNRGSRGKSTKTKPEEPSG